MASIIRKIYTKFFNTNDIYVSDNAKIAKSCMLQNVSINGNITVGKNSKIVGGVRMHGTIIVGKNTSINGANTTIHAGINKIVIGNFCSIARNVDIQEFNHHTNKLSTYYYFTNIQKQSGIKDIVSKGSIIIGNDVWIGAQSIVLSGSTIGDGAIIGAHSVVNGKIPPYAIAIGNPAKVIKYRFDEKITSKLLSLKWWDWSDEKLRESASLFEQEITLEILEKF